MPHVSSRALRSLLNGVALLVGVISVATSASHQAHSAEAEIQSDAVERRSYGTQRETEPPRYVKQLNKTWLNNNAALADIDWLDIGFEYRARFEHRDNDFRRAQQNLDEPILLRSRAYLGLKNILDPFRFAIELQDSRRNHSDYSRSNDTRDINKADILQGYLELYIQDSVFGLDDLGHRRPFWIRAGRLAWEAVDKRLIARNEWRNTTNTFQGIRANIGDQHNDWQLEVFGVKPVQRFTEQLDVVDHSQQFYGVTFDWRGWSPYLSVQPYYFLLKQDGSAVKYDLNGNAYSDRLVYTNTQQQQAMIDRDIHTAGLRIFGLVPDTQIDFDASTITQWGHEQRFINAREGAITVAHDAYAYNAEIGYTFRHDWKPRFSVFYGVASGDKLPAIGDDVTANQRFDRLFGFARPLSSNDYIQMENIRTPKLRLEFEPKGFGLDTLKVDTGFSWYRLDSASDRWSAGANLKDRTGQSGRDLGKEFDLRVRFPINHHASFNMGFAHFWAGDFIKHAVKLPANNNDALRASQSNFFYTELTLLGF